jgi:putative DNA-invertase from lambdoid prophage Rac
MSVYGYTRVSTERQAKEGLSLEVQQRQLMGYALMHGLTIDAIVVEEGVSGSVPITARPKGGALFAKLQKGDIVLAPKLDRLFRSALDALIVVEDMRKRGVSLHMLDLGGDISNNGMSKFFLTMAAAFAEVERDVLRERIGQAKADHRKQGRFLGGAVPFGYRRGGEGNEFLVPHDAEQKAIREIRRLKAQGKPLRAIADAMRAKGIAISHVGVANVLRSARAAS